MNGLEFRNLTAATLGDMIEVLAKARVDDPYERRLTMDEANEYTFLDPDFDPRGSWFAILDGETVGFGSCLVESNRITAGMDDAYVDIDVIPEHRHEGIEQRLLDRQLDYIRSRGVGKALCRSIAGNDWMRSLLASNSFEELYRVFVLVRRGREEVQRVMVPDGFRLERTFLTDYTDEDIEELVEAFNDSFRDHMNFAPERKERFVNFRDCNKDPRVLTLAMRGGEIVGFCLSEESETFNRERKVKTGWVDILGVRPPYRRKGIGRALLADGIDWILDRGMDTVHLGVFARNEKALGLYLSFGFSKERESIWFRKNLR